MASSSSSNDVTKTQYCWLSSLCFEIANKQLQAYILSYQQPNEVLSKHLIGELRMCVRHSHLSLWTGKYADWARLGSMSTSGAIARPFEIRVQKKLSPKENWE